MRQRESGPGACSPRLRGYPGAQKSRSPRFMRPAMRAGLPEPVRRLPHATSGVALRPIHPRKGTAMKIHFPHDAPQYCGPDLVVTFPALVDGERIDCSITAEALEDHFGAPSSREEDAMRAFDHHRHRIEHAARRMLEEVGKKPVILHSGYFRFYD